MNKMRLLFALISLLTFFSVNGQNGLNRSFLKLGDTLTLCHHFPFQADWYELVPVQGTYENLSKVPGHFDRNYFAKIKYVGRRIGDGKSLSVENVVDSAGTYLFGVFEIGGGPNEGDTIESGVHLGDHFGSNVFQVVVRNDDSYFGYLSELFRTPFILPPKKYSDGNHQTDLQVGSDCAEFLIYGRRRMGHDLKYGGPHRIKDYLLATDSLEKGTIVHFETQTSVMYEDRGVIGQLDAPDIFWQSLDTGPVKVSYQNSGYYGRSFKLYRWK